jgi:glycosyltransferase involved in cell wall biosynthesis
MDKGISVVVPVYNEERTVRAVVGALLASRLVDEVVCVNDGSTDGSLGAMASFGPAVVLIDQQPNRGKGAALAAGITRARGETVVFVDADLTTLAPEHLVQLVLPLGDDDVRAVLGIPGGDLAHRAVSALLRTEQADPIGAALTGQRAYRRADLLPHLERMASTRFGVEVYLNSVFPQSATEIVTLDGLIALGKQDKHGWRLAVREYPAELLEVVRELARIRTGRLQAGRPAA